MLYLKSAKAADRLALTFDSVVADVYWIRTIQHYGRDYKNRSRSNRFELLYPLLDLTTTLDPHFLIAYRFGAHFLSPQPPEGPGRPDQAITLLERGLKVAPEQWKLANDIGFIHYLYTGNYKEAAHWFDRASRMRGAPVWMKQLAATTLAGGGDRKGATQMLLEMRASEEPSIQRAADRALAQIRGLDGADDLTRMVQAFKARTGRYPASWQDLGLQGVPADPALAPYHFDPSTGQVTIAPDSPLMPIIPTLLGK
jgi:TPR repeat protein